MSQCLFCKIINKEIKSDIVYEDDDLLVFKDINPQAPVHLLIIPKKHISSLNEIDPVDIEILGKLNLIVKKLSSDFRIEKSGYRVVVNTNSDAGQAVFHIHWHLLGGRKMTWPPG